MTPEEFLRVADFFPDAALLLAKDGTVLAANRAFADLGHAPAGLPGRRLADLSATPAEGVREYLRLCSRSRQPVPGALELLAADGREVPCRCYGAVAGRDAADGSTAVLLRLDPTATSQSRFAVLNQKLGELTEEIRRRRLAEERLREQREWLSVTLSSIGDAVITTDEAARVTFLNPVAEALTGWADGEGRGRPLEEVSRIVNEYTREPVENPARKVLSDGAVVGLANHTVLIAKDGAERPIDDSGAPIRSGDGRVAGVVLVFRDVTERKRAEDELRDASRRKDEFLAMLAHELRNPLAPIKSGLDLLRMDGGNSDVVDVMSGQVEHLVRLVDDLLDVSRILRGRVELRRRPVALAEAVRRAAEAVRPMTDADGQSFSVSLPDGPVWLDADPVRIAQVLGNLLANASKYTEPGGGIALSAGGDGAEAVVTVTDTGVGIEADLLPRVFDLFTQSRRSIDRSQGGLGIGLTVVKGLVEMHGGTVTAASDGPGRGSTFTVRLPLGPAAEAAKHAGDRDGAADGRGAVGRVLVVDDNVPGVKLLVRLLSKLVRADVETAHDGEQALEAAGRLRPDLILLDIGLPKLDGYEVARRLRERPEFRDTLLVALTGYGTPDDRRRSIEAGFDEHLVKPPGVETLRSILGHPKLKRT